MQREPVVFQVASLLESWISPLKVSVAMVAHWNGHLIGERLSRHTLKNQQVVEADQWGQLYASQWLSVGVLLRLLVQQRARLIPDHPQVSNQVVICVRGKPGIDLGSLDSYINVQVVNTSGENWVVHRPELDQYYKRCKTLCGQLSFDTSSKLSLKFETDKHKTDDAYSLLRERGLAPEDLTGFRHVARDIKQLIADTEKQSLQSFSKRWTSVRRRINRRGLDE